MQVPEAYKWFQQVQEDGHLKHNYIYNALKTNSLNACVMKYGGHTAKKKTLREKKAH